MTAFSEMLSIDALFRLFQIVAIVAGALAVLALIGKDVTSGILSQRNVEKMLLLQKEVAEARTKQAEAELKLEELRQTGLMRVFAFDFKKFVEALKGKPNGKAIVLYKNDDSEAYMFAQRISLALMDAGWQTSPTPEPTRPTDGPNPDRLPSEMVTGISGFSNGRSSGVGIVANDINPSASGSLYAVLQNAFLTTGWGVSGKLDAALPANTVQVMVGAKQ